MVLNVPGGGSQGKPNQGDQEGGWHEPGNQAGRKAGEDGVRDPLLLLFLLPCMWNPDVCPGSGFGEGLPGLRSGSRG
jgi:hypothetical protein